VEARVRPAGAALALAILAVAGGCDAFQPPQAPPLADEASKPAAPPPAAQPTPAPDPRIAIRDETPKLHFEWSAPPQVLKEPALLDMLRAEAVRARSEATESAEQEPREDISHFYKKEWQVTADTPRLLALSAHVDTFTGGAHGMQTFDSLIWDRQAQRRLGFGDLFATPAEAYRLLTPAFCRGLDAERAKKREGVESGGGWMDECPELAELTIVLARNSTATDAGGSGDDRIDRLTVLIEPYTAGPYAEGSYEVALPFPLPLQPLLKPDYAPLFTTGLAAPNPGAPSE
jgi:hypothetical protein